jgi:PII-like signaling protein
MEESTTATMVRLYLPETGHNARKAQLEKVLQLLREQLHVHGVRILHGLMEEGGGPTPQYEGVGDLLRRNPDPPVIVEFFEEVTAAKEIRRVLRSLVPNSYAVFWSVAWERPASAERRLSTPADAGRAAGHAATRG